MRGLRRAGEPDDSAGALAAVEALAAEARGLDAADSPNLCFAAALTLRPRASRAAWLAPLREAGLDDRGIHDVVQVACCFAYMNRLADGQGVALTPPRYALARDLFGDRALAEHLAWARGE